MKFEFNLVPESTHDYFQAIRFLIKIKPNLTNLNNTGSYSDSYSEDQAQRFEVTLYEKSIFHWGVQAKRSIRGTKIQTLSLKLKTGGQRGGESAEKLLIRLEKLNLRILSNSTKRAFSFNFSHENNVVFSDNNNWYNISLTTLWILIFKYTIYPIATSIILIFISITTSKAAISKHIFFKKYGYFLTKDFYAFSTLEFFPFTIITILYLSPWSLIAFVFYS